MLGWRPKVRDGHGARDAGDAERRVRPPRLRHVRHGRDEAAGRARGREGRAEAAKGAVFSLELG